MNRRLVFCMVSASLLLATAASANSLNDFSGQYTLSTGSSSCAENMTIATLVKGHGLVIKNDRGTDRIAILGKNKNKSFVTHAEFKKDIFTVTETRFKRVLGINWSVLEKNSLALSIADTSANGVTEKSLRAQQTAQKRGHSSVSLCSYKFVDGVVVEPIDPISPLPAIDPTQVEKKPRTSYVKISPTKDLLNLNFAEENYQYILTVMSATHEYHKDLYQIAEKEKKITAEQIIYLMGLAYFNASTQQLIDDKIKEYRDAEQKVPQQLILNQNLAEVLGWNINQIASDSIDKVKSLTDQQVNKILESLVATSSDSSAVFDKILKRSNDIPRDLNLAQLAESKHAFVTSAGVYKEIFEQQSSELTYDSILDFIENVKTAEVRDILFVELMKRLPELSDEQTFAVLKLMTTRHTEFASMAFDLIKKVTFANIAKAAKYFSNNSYRQDQDERDAFILKQAERLNLITLDSILDVAKILNWGKSTWISNKVDKLSIINFDEVKKASAYFSNNSYRQDQDERDAFIIRQAERLQLSTMDSIIEVAKLLNWEKGKWISNKADKLKSINFTDVQKASAYFANNSYRQDQDERDAFIIRQAERLELSTMDSIIEVAKMLNWEKGKWISGKVDKLASFTFAEIVKASAFFSNNSYRQDQDERDAFIIRQAERLQLSTMDSIIEVAKLLNWEKGKWISNKADKLKSINFTDVKKASAYFANNSYRQDQDEKDAFIIRQAERLDLSTIDAIISVAKLLNWDKWAFISSKVEKLSLVTASDILAVSVYFSNNHYDQSRDAKDNFLLNIAFVKITSLTQAEANTLINLVNWSGNKEKAKILLKSKIIL